MVYSSIKPLNIAIVPGLSFFIIGVPVKPIKQALGNVNNNFSLPSPDCVLCASSIKTKISLSVSSKNGFFNNANFCIKVVITSKLFFSNNFLKCSDDFVCVTDFFILQSLKVVFICLSKSRLSVTITIRTFPISSIKFLTNITIDKLFPLPCVCQISPPFLLPLLLKVEILFNAFFIAKNC